MRNYIELDHDLVPGKISDINNEIDLPTGKVVTQKKDKKSYDLGDKTSMEVKKYKIDKGDVFQAMARSKDLSNFEAVAGSKSVDFYYDHDFGFFSTILACYNNHWVLRTSPDDWWNVIVRNIAQAVDTQGEKRKVRDFFVDHEGKKTIEVALPGRLDQVDYSWLFDQFSEGIRMNIKTPGYVDLMEADFTTTTSDQLIASQIMIMSSVQKYFDFCEYTLCGIPGVEMKGTLADWKQLVVKTENMKSLLQPIIDELGLQDWFIKTLDILKKLVDTFNGNPDKEWWGHILSWNETYGSGGRSWWSGWMIDFLMAGEAENPQDFKSGVVSVPLKIEDENFGPPVSDTGELVAGTFGYTVEEGEQAPVVEANQGWLLLLPKGSPVISRMKGDNMETTT